MSIFGISLIDNFGFDFIKNFLTEIRVITASVVGYLSETHFYSFIASLFNKKEELTKTGGSTPSMSRENPSSEQGI